MIRKLKFQEYVTTIGFVILIFGPIIAWFFVHDAVGEDTSEYRMLAKWPEFSLEKIQDFPDGFEEYFNDHAPFRGQIRETWTNLNYRLLRDSTNKTVIVGKTDKDSDAYTWLLNLSSVREVQGIKIYSNKELKRMLSLVKTNNERMDNLGIDFHYFIAPDKEDVYYDMLPSNLSIYNSSSAAQKAIDYLSENGISNIAFAREEIINAKNLGQPLYYRQDTHWNDLGAFYGFKSLMNEIEPSFTDFSYELEWKEKASDSEDLARSFGLKGYFRDESAKVHYHDEKRYKVVKDEDGSNKIWIAENQEAPINKTLLLVGDSYRSALKPYLARTFSKVIMVHRDNYRLNMIDEYNPDVVVSEMVERSAKALYTNRV